MEGTTGAVAGSGVAAAAAAAAAPSDVEQRTDRTGASALRPRRRRGGDGKPRKSPGKSQTGRTDRSGAVSGQPSRGAPGTALQSSSDDDGVTTDDAAKAAGGPKGPKATGWSLKKKALVTGAALAAFSALVGLAYANRGSLKAFIDRATPKATPKTTPSQPPRRR